MERTRSWTSLGLAGALLILGLVACGDPYAEVKAGMTASEAARFDRGRRVATPCWTCHDLTGEAFKVGPPLRGLFGRRIASVPGYGYSDSFRSAGFAWGERELGAFLANPQGFIVGTSMVSPGIQDPFLRRDLLFFLRYATQPR